MLNFFKDIWFILQEMPLFLFSSLLGLLGLLIGSFLNVVIVRLPVMMEKQERFFVFEYLKETLILNHKNININPNNNNNADNNDNNISHYINTVIPNTFNNLNETYTLYKPASHCPQCKATIKWWMNIPVISYILLKGCCYQCKLSISFQYPCIELSASILSVVAGLYWGDLASRETAIAGMGLLLALLTLTAIDFKTQLLPDMITLPLMWVGLLLNINTLFVPLSIAVWGAIGGYLSLWSVCYLYKLLTGKQGMGHGDFKLLAALGAWLGIKMILPIILIASVLGSIIGIVLIKTKKIDQSNYIAFGPYLAIAGGICAMYGETIISAYLGYIKLT